MQRTPFSPCGRRWLGALSAAKDAETDEGCWTERNAAWPARVPREPLRASEHATPLWSSIFHPKHPPAFATPANAGVRPTPLIRPPLRCAAGRPPSPTRGEGQTARAIDANLPADQVDSNLGAGGLGVTISEFHAMWTVLARCGCRGSAGLGPSCVRWNSATAFTGFTQVIWPAQFQTLVACMPSASIRRPWSWGRGFVVAVPTAEPGGDPCEPTQ